MKKIILILMSLMPILSSAQTIYDGGTVTTYQPGQTTVSDDSGNVMQVVTPTTQTYYVSPEQANQYYNYTDTTTTAYPDYNRVYNNPPNHNSSNGNDATRNNSNTGRITQPSNTTAQASNPVFNPTTKSYDTPKTTSSTTSSSNSNTTNTTGVNRLSNQNNASTINSSVGNNSTTTSQ